MKRYLIAIITILTILIMPNAVFAWSQDTHKQINLEAVIKFRQLYDDNEKYKLAPIDARGRFLGLQTTSSSLFEKDYKDILSYNTYAGWIIDGGSSADEPHLYESVRHFYDPTKDGNGPTWLTDQITAHGYIYNLNANGYPSPEIDAKNWALYHPDNPYSFKKAKEYYKKAMTISENDTAEGFESDGLFRSRDLDAKNLDEQRSYYLGAAFRALGETMHLMADMTQPAHVRNDSHPITEPIEQGIGAADVSTFVQEGSPVDPRVGQYYTTTGSDTALTVDNLFVQTATFTNKYFYTSDTIYDSGEWVYPNNGEDPYPSPQFPDLVKKEIALENGKSIKSYYGVFNGTEVPMASQDIMKVVLEGYKDAMEYSITPSYARAQGKVVIPIAIAACADVLDRFFPTLELTAEAQEEVAIQDKRGEEYAAIPVDVKLVHHYQQDPEWGKDMEIRYSGPGKLIFEKDGEITDTYKLHFENGTISEIQEGRKMVEKPLQLYLKKSPKAKLSKEEGYYEVTDGMSVHIEVNAGARLLNSGNIDIFEDEKYLEISFDPASPVLADKISFETQLIPEGYYVWDFGDDESYEGFEANTCEYQYEEADKYTVSVVCYRDISQIDAAGRGKTEITVKEKFDMAILPSNNLEAKAGDEVQISTAPSEADRSIEGFTLEWDCPGGTIKSKVNNTVNLLYEKGGTYGITVTALDSSGKVAGEGKAVISIVEDESSVDPRIEYFKQFDRGYFEYDYSKFVLDERNKSVSIQEPNYLGGMKMTFYDDENTIIQSVRYFRTDLDYSKYSKYTKEDFEKYPHVLPDLIRKTEWAVDGYDKDGNFVSQTLKMPDEKGVLMTSRFFSFYDNKFTAISQGRYLEGDPEGEQLWLTIEFVTPYASSGYIIEDTGEIHFSNYVNGQAVESKTYNYAYQYDENMFDSAAAIKKYLLDNFKTVDDVSNRSKYETVLQMSKGFITLK